MASLSPGPIRRGQAGLTRDWEVMTDQIRTVANSRLARPLGPAPAASLDEVQRQLGIIMDFGGFGPRSSF